MPSLSLIQAAFHDAHFLGDPQTVAPFIVEDGIPAKDRLRIYRNNTFITLAEALAATFPVIKRLIGEDCFTFAAQRFTKIHPPRPGPLFEFGESFPDFLRDFEPVANLEYLPDVGHLEWAMNTAYHAAEAVPLNPAELKSVPNAQHPELRFALHPSRSLLMSPYPIHRIWQANQADAHDATVALDHGAKLLVVRPHSEVLVHALDQGEFGFLLALGAGQTVAVSAAAAIRTDPAFDLNRAMVKLLNSGVFTAFSHGPQSNPTKENEQ